MPNVNHNGNVHNIVSDMQLLELSDGHIYYALPNGADYFRFTVVGTDLHTGHRKHFKFLLLTTLGKGDRSTLDAAYIKDVITRTVEEVLARENHFITGRTSYGQQFDRAFVRNILTPTCVAHRYQMGRAITLASVYPKDAEPNDEFLAAMANATHVIEYGGKVAVYVSEDTPKWGHNDFRVKMLDPCTPHVNRAVLRHANGRLGNTENTDESIVRERLDGVLKTIKVTFVTERRPDPEFGTPEYQRKLDELDNTLRQPRFAGPHHFRSSVNPQSKTNQKKSAQR